VSADEDTVEAERLKAEGPDVTMTLRALWAIVAGAAQRGANGQDPRWLADQAVIVAAQWGAS
jgi:hypothetical protein